MLGKERKSTHTCSESIILYKRLPRPTRPRHQDVKDLPNRVALNPVEDNAEAHNDVDGHDGEPNGAARPAAARDAQQRQRERRLAQHGREDREQARHRQR